MHENEIAKIILNESFKIHKTFGGGLLENAYEALLKNSLIKQGFRCTSQESIKLVYEGMVIENAYRLDLLVDNKVIVELKSIAAIDDSHKKQLLTYLKLTNKRLGLLVNFGEPWLKNGIHRIVCGL